MSNKGTPMQPATRQKMRLSKQKHSIPDLIIKTRTYLDQFNSPTHTPDKLPSLSQLCLTIPCSRQSLLEYASQSPELQSLIEQLDLLQETYLLNRADQAKNPTFQIFLLKSKHHYTDQPTQLTQNNTFNISPDLLADALALMQKTPDK